MRIPTWSGAGADGDPCRAAVVALEDASPRCLHRDLRDGVSCRGERLAQEAGASLIADFRDPWTRSLGRTGDPYSAGWRKTAEQSTSSGGW
jgi:hypothetical protein